ncbi:hypothetical protein [Quadrisphaera sp. INWT6]|uniref:hypothetical protein n=1 Tax=Quadrisphaera sp. INWT6 TaxID=2596917 RepID=UPI001891FBFB|nr:hypothetical protein [Quadrisphaera sp. INWT6]MBF5080705.1 hypothetical protein [Quadrisphaera sp. INWT6]
MDDAAAPLRHAPPGARDGDLLRVAVLDEQLRPPGWAAADPAWSPLVLGWESAGGDRVGRALVLRRHVPGSRRFLALLPEPPRLGGLEREPALWRPQAVALLRRLGAFAVRFGFPAPAQALPRTGASPRG